jgi:hypothetical protein
MCATAGFAQTKVVVIPMSGKRAVGDATVQDVVEGKIFSNNSDVGLTGIRSPGVISATGQTLCFIPTCMGTPCSIISCVDTGQDGEFQMGVSVAIRFTNNEDGTVSDRLTGLIWLREGNCPSFFIGDVAGDNRRTWPEALLAAKELSSGYCGLTDGSVAGDWRIPNIRELSSLVDYSQSNPSLPAGHPFLNINFPQYWSSTNDALYMNYSWLVDFSHGNTFYETKSSNDYNVIAVRGGQ